MQIAQTSETTGEFQAPKITRADLDDLARAFDTDGRFYSLSPIEDGFIVNGPIPVVGPVEVLS